MTQPITLLTIDDEASLRRAIRSFFEDLGFKVLEAEDGRQGLAVFREKAPTVVLVDLRMPGLNGLEVIDVLVQEAPEVPTIVLSGTGVIADAIEALRHGAWDFVTKPVADMAHLEHVVQKALERARLRTESRQYQARLEEEVVLRTRELVELNDRLRGVVASARRIAVCTALQDAGERLLGELATGLAADGGSLYLVERGTLVLRHSLGPGHPPEAIALPAPADSILGKALGGKRPMLAGDTLPAQSLPSGWTGGRDESLLAFPLFESPGEPLGVITLHRKGSSPFTRQDGDVGEILVSHGVEVIRVARAHEALRQSEERFRTLFENLPTIPIQGYSADGTVRFWNRANEAVYGYTAEEALGRDLVELIIPPEMRAEAREAIRYMAATGETTPPSELSLMRKGGSRVAVYSSHAVVRLPGQPPELFCIDVDLTAMKQAEQEQQKLEGQLRQAQKMETVGRLAGGIAHDLNNLLTPILGYTELALLKLTPPEVERLNVRVIQEAAWRARDLTQQLLAFSRKQQLNLRPIRLSEIVDQFEKILRRAIREDVRLVIHLAPSLGTVRGDAAQLQQVLLNLAINANDAMPTGGTLTIAVDEVVCPAARAKGPRDASILPSGPPGDYVRLAVTDTGCGMSAETQQHLFEPFFTTKPEGRGTGLGLATCYGIVKQHGGYFQVRSAPGQGSTFTVYLPRAEGAAAEGGGAPLASVARGKETVLVVDDSESVCSLLENMLATLGYTPLLTADPESALRIARQHPDPIHLVITDVIMPGMNGRQLYDALKKIRPDLRALYMSGYTDEIVAPHGVLEAGIHFLAKPFTIMALTEKIREALETRE